MLSPNNYYCKECSFRASFSVGYCQMCGQNSMKEIQYFDEKQDNIEQYRALTFDERYTLFKKLTNKND